MTSIGMHDQEANLSLWATQGGGYARKTADGDFVWHELPEWMSSLPDGDPDKLAIGDPIHPEWDLIPVSVSARDERSASMILSRWTEHQVFFGDNIVLLKGSFQERKRWRSVDCWLPLGDHIFTISFPFFPGTPQVHSTQCISGVELGSTAAWESMTVDNRGA